MKRKLFTAVMLIVVTVATVFGFAACNKNGNDETIDGAPKNIRVVAPDGTPALALFGFFNGNDTFGNYKFNSEIISPSLVSTEFSGKADVIIAPTNAGANFSKKSGEYKLFSVAVEGSLYVRGKGEGVLTLEKLVSDLKAGKKMASIGKGNTPELVFSYILGEDYASVSENIEWVADGPAARAAMMREDNPVSYILVGEPAATAFTAPLSLTQRLDLQALYKGKSGYDNYPQASVFVKTALLLDANFVNSLSEALKKSIDAVNSDDTSAETVNAVLKAAGSTSVFPADSKNRANVVFRKADSSVKNSVTDYLALMGINDVSGIFAF